MGHVTESVLTGEYLRCLTVCLQTQFTMWGACLSLVLHMLHMEELFSLSSSVSITNVVCTTSVNSEHIPLESVTSLLSHILSSLKTVLSSISFPDFWLWLLAGRILDISLFSSTPALDSLIFIVDNRRLTHCCTFLLTFLLMTAISESARNGSKNMCMLKVFRVWLCSDFIRAQSQAAKPHNKLCKEKHSTQIWL